MAIRVTLLSAAHVHAGSYAWCAQNSADLELVAVWDHQGDRGVQFAEQWGSCFVADLDEAIGQADAVVIASENLKHGVLLEAAVRAGKPALCEKPIAGSQEEFERISALAKTPGAKLMTAFPCPYSPAFERAMQRFGGGEIGDLVGISATNRGTCPFDWFVDPALSGGGAVVDHVVHVADLFFRILGAEPATVYAAMGNNLYGQIWEDSGLVSFEYESGVIASLDSSWSRPKSYKTWGDVTLSLAGTKGTLELSLFEQQIDVFKPGTKTHTVAGYGSNLDLLMMQDFVAMIRDEKPPRATIDDGLRASRCALMAYESANQKQPVSWAS